MKGILEVPNALKYTDDLEKVGVKCVLGARLLILPIDPHTYIHELEKQKLLYAPESARDKVIPPPSTGIIIMLGDGIESVDKFGMPLQRDLRPGAAILFNKFGLSSIKIGGTTLGIIDIADVMAVLEVEGEPLKT
jgi:co-chaperonin GroES (HSP10)